MITFYYNISFRYKQSSEPTLEFRRQYHEEDAQYEALERQKNPPPSHQDSEAKAQFGSIEVTNDY